MTERKYEDIPVDKIKVLNPRNRGKTKFQEIIRSIKEVGLLKPILVSTRNFKRTGHYELICGQGRYLAFKELGYSHIPAEIRSCSKKEALLYSLVENIARVPPGTMWFAYEIKRVHDEGWSYAEISKIVGKCESYIRDYIRLVEQGEARLIKGVEQGLFPITFAMLVARSDNSTIQNVLMDAFDTGIISSNNTSSVRKIIETRIKRGKQTGNRRGRSRLKNYSVKNLKADISKITKEKRSFNHEANIKVNRLLTLLDGINTIWKDKKLVALLKVEGLDQRPRLKGEYHV